MLDIRSLLGLTPDSMQNQIMMRQAQARAQSPSASSINDVYGVSPEESAQPVDIFGEGITQDPSPQFHSPVMRMAAARKQSGYEPTSGSKMEAQSRNSIDDLMEKLASQREQGRQDDRTQQWMSFFGKLASSSNPRLLGSLGEGANALAETTGKQASNNKLLDRSALEDQIKYEEWNRDQARQQQLANQTGAYQEGELGLRKDTLEQGKYQMSPYGQVLNTKTGELVSNGGLPVNTMDENGKSLTGDAYLATLDPRVATLAKSYANGDVAWPSGFALKNPMVLQATIAAKQYDPTTNGNRFPAVNKFNTGKQGDQVRSFDVGISHLNTLSTLVDGLDNKDINLVNKVANTWKQQTGDEAPTDFNAAKEVVGNEIVKAIVGAGGGVGDREKAQQALNAANSPAQLKGVIKTYKTLMSGQLGGLKQQYENSTGRKDFYDRLSQNSRSEMIPATAQPDSGSSTDYSHLWSQ